MNTEQAIKAVEKGYVAVGDALYIPDGNTALKHIILTALCEKQERENPEPQSGVKGIWIEEDDDEIEITVHRRDKPVRICVGTGDVVIVEKLYGPAVLKDLRIECTYHGWKVSGDDVIMEIGELALEVLREKAERDKGCEYCNDPDMEAVAANYCPSCGAKMEDKP